jgi:phosphatidylinositol alpha 1,6-mannosyltransferase
MKVVHVSDCYLPRLGGIEIQLAELARMQQASGHEVEIVTATPDRKGGERAIGSPVAPAVPVAPDVPVHRVVAPVPFELPVHPRTGRLVGELLARRRPDVVHLHVGAISPFAWAAARAAVRQHLPVVVTVHSMWDPATAAVYRVLDAAYGWSEWPGIFTAVSQAAAEPIRSMVGLRVPVHVVANGIDTAAWQRAVPRPGAAVPDQAVPDHAVVRPGERARRPDEVHVVSVGRLAPRKKPLSLLRTLRLAQEALDGSATRLRATIVGDGPAAGMMAWYLRQYAMEDWVTLSGRLDRRQVGAVLADADLFLAPARRESFGLAALEARLSGVPVVAYADSGIASFVVPEKEGLLATTPAELVGAVVRLARDGALRASVADHNRVSVPEHCSWPVVLAAFDEGYAQAVARTPAVQVP